jgi:NTE family protein
VRGAEGLSFQTGHYVETEGEGAMVQSERVQGAEREAARKQLGVVLTGGGARGAYQVGVMRWIARNFPDDFPSIITGISAGAVNAVHLAAHHGTFPQAAQELVGLWEGLTPERVFEVGHGDLARKVVRWGAQLVSGGLLESRYARGLVDTAPLRRYLEEAMASVHSRLTGIDYNLDHGRLRAVAVVTTSYATGQTVVWVQGRKVKPWTRPLRRTVLADITVEHVMASAALPLFFPAVRLGDSWYGDGGVRLIAPLSPALHLGASRILAISTRFERSQTEADRPRVFGYPPPIHVAGMLMNAIFLDLIDQDANRMERINQLIERLPPDQRDGMRPIDLMVLRPSEDLAALAAEYEPRLPGAFRFLGRGLGSRETATPDILSLLMFQPDYVRRLIALGEADAERRAEEIDAFMGRPAPAALMA